MKKFKFIKYLVFTGILGVSPLPAEESGWFVGAEFGTSGVEIEYEYFLKVAVVLSTHKNNNLTAINGAY